MKGRRPKTEKLRIVHGSEKPRGKGKPGDKQKPPPEPIRCPSSIPAGARAAWKRLAPGAIERGALRPGFEEAFARMCNEVAAYWRLSRKIEKEGETYKAGEYHKPHPAVMMRTAAAMEARLLGERFGMDPLASQRLDLGGDGADDDPLEALLKRREKKA